MASVTDEAVEKSRENLAKKYETRNELRRQLREAESARNNGVAKARIDAEAEAVDAEIASLRDKLLVSKVDESEVKPAPPKPAVTEEAKENK